MAAAKSYPETCITGGIFGDTTKGLRQVWDQRVVDEDRDILADESKIRQLFNDLKLYPSKSQVHEMVHCAREGDVRSDFLTFGEFCLFATELRRHYDQNTTSAAVLVPKALPYKNQRNMSVDSCTSGDPPANSKGANNSAAAAAAKKKSSNGSCSYDVFLGGSCNPTVWRKDIAIPHFKSRGITFYNPQQSNWVPEMIELEHQAKQTSQLLFFVVNEKTRNVVSMIEISYMAGKKRKLICYLGKYPERNHKISNEAVGRSEWLDLHAGLTVVNDLVERQGIPVFDSIEVALECATKVIKQDLDLEELSIGDGARPVQHADFQIGDRLVRLREAFDAVDTSRSGKISLNDLKMAFRIHVHRDLASSDLKKISSFLKTGDSGIDFNGFCCIVADFKQKKQKHRDSSEASESREKPVKMKHERVKNFFCKVFHRSSRHQHAQQRRELALSRPNQAQSAAAAASDAEPLVSKSQFLLRADPQINSGAAAGGASLHSRRGSSVRDVYLGGSANGSWRQDQAVPLLKKHGLTYFNPQSVTRRLMPMWAAAIDNSRVLLFVILGNSRSLGAMNEAAFYIGQGHNVVLVVQGIQADTPVIGDSFSSQDPGEVLSKAALKDYNRGRSYLSDIANREGVPVFDNVTEALQCVVDKCKGQT